MINVHVEYKIKAEFVDKQIESINTYLASMHEANDPGINYRVFQLEDGVTFIHRIIYQNERSKADLIAADFFQSFLERQKLYVDGEETVTTAKLIGEYTP